MASKFFGAISHIGGSDGDLDLISKDIISDGDGAFVLDSTNNTIDFYTLESSTTTAEDAVNFTVIIPDDEAAAPAAGKRWIKLTSDPITNTIYAKAGETGIVLTADGAVSLYYDGIKSFSALSDGIAAYDTSGNQATMYYYSSAGVSMGITWFNNGSYTIYDDINNYTILQSLAGTSVALYYAGNTCIETASYGFDMYRPDDTSMTAQISIANAGSLGNLKLSALNPGASVTLRARNVADSATNMVINGSGDGAAELYYAGTSHFSTIDDGVEITVAGGCLTIPEITTPTADGSKGKVYCKSDNKLYFQDGAGAEHEVAFV